MSPVQHHKHEVYLILKAGQRLTGSRERYKKTLQKRPSCDSLMQACGRRREMSSAICLQDKEVMACRPGRPSLHPDPETLVLTSQEADLIRNHSPVR